MEIDDDPVLDLWEDYIFFEIVDNYFDISGQIQDDRLGYFEINMEFFNELLKDWNKGIFADKLTKDQSKRVEDIINRISEIFKDGPSIINYGPQVEVTELEVVRFYYETKIENPSNYYPYLKEFKLGEVELLLDELKAEMIFLRLVPYYVAIPLLKEIIQQNIDNIESLSEIVKKRTEIDSVLKMLLNLMEKPKREFKYPAYGLSYMIFNFLAENNYQPLSSKAYFIKYMEIGDNLFDVTYNWPFGLYREYCNRGNFHDIESRKTPIEYGIYTFNYECFKSFYNDFNNNPKLKKEYESYLPDFENEMKEINTLIENDDILIKNNQMLFYFE
ncbi:hypothetical protein HYG87_00575 [Methanobacterium alkalithermotolerans]|uniref:Uncharacterized protein n=1 Tax=Methanobacterium alkalithermotolerans TaxID=2731220 RepID=A0A8T8K5G5_9EURY|nr:hypothetical protein [Methanobacterium alkalithermotolerans]QUH22363.1 hypothetical protein HYG87_00575 [Methanobacterium alkalithermotolerans]